MPFVSNAQRKFFHWAAGRPGSGIDKAMVKHWEHATPENADLPEHVADKKKKKKKKSVSAGLSKAAVELYREALITETAPMQTAVPGTELRSNAETGQARGRATRTGVLNEDRQFAGKYKHNWRNTRVP